MKKFCVVMFLAIFVSTQSNASVLGNYLSTKSGAENRIYNLVIESYNNFKRNFKSEVLDYCKNQMISGGGINQIIQQTKCEYNAAVDLLSSNDINFDRLYIIPHEIGFSLAEIIFVFFCFEKKYW